ncbi:MAG: hypothetical protein PVI26_13270 [Chitinispirillia bacterium]|jgi:flagellar basal body-associated protein FliL
MADSWEELRTKNLKRIPRLILLFFILFISGVFFINNFDFFTKERKTDESEQDRINDITILKNETKGVDGKNDIPRTKTIDSVSSFERHKEKSIKNGDTLMKSIELQGIKCLLADKDSLAIQVSFKLLFKDEKIESEILLKRDDLINIIKKVIQQKKLSEIVINKLRVECKSELNKLLKKGKIDDIEFFDFRPLNSL